MAFSTSTPPASSLDSDAPILIYSQALDYASATHAGRWASSRSMTAADLSASGFPAHLAYDGKWSRTTKPNASAVTWYLNFYCDPNVPVDYAVILEDNFAEAGVGIALDLVTSNADAFSSPSTMHSVGSTVYSSKVRRVLKLTNRYSNLERVSLGITVASGTFLPRIGELWLGRRYQFETQPNEPWSHRSRRTNTDRIVTPYGVVTDVITGEGQLFDRPVWHLGSTTERDAVREVFEKSRHGGRGMIWIPRPVTAPSEAYVVSVAPELEIPVIAGGSPNIHEVALNLEERAPYYASEPGAA